MMTDKQDYYELLGVSRDAELNDIKKAYRKLAREHHPDVNSGDKESEDHFKKLNEAYQVLCDPQKREVYDRYGHQGFEHGYSGSNSSEGFSDFGGFGDIFDMFFGAGAASGSSRSKPTAERGNDLRFDVELTLEEAAHGVSRAIRLSRLATCETCQGSGAQPGSNPETCGTCHGAGQVRQQVQSFFGTQIRITACPKCHGEGHIIGSPCHDCSGQGRARKTIEKSVDVPAGVDSGMRVRLVGEGDAGKRGGPSGDLYLFTHVKPHDLFERRGSDLWYQLPIGVALGAIGGSVEVRTIDDSEHLNIHAGTQSGDTFKLRGKGMPDPNTGRVGDLNVVIKVQTPTKLNQEQKDLLRKFAQLRGEEIKESHEKGFFERVKDAFTGQ